MAFKWCHFRALAHALLPRAARLLHTATAASAGPLLHTATSASAGRMLVCCRFLGGRRLAGAARRASTL